MSEATMTDAKSVGRDERRRRRRHRRLTRYAVRRAVEWLIRRLQSCGTFDRAALIREVGRCVNNGHYVLPYYTALGYAAPHQRRQEAPAVIRRAELVASESDGNGYHTELHW